MRWVTAKRLLFFAVLVTVTLMAMHYTAPERARLIPLENKFRDVMAPVQTGLTWLGGQARKLASFPVSMVGAAERWRQNAAVSWSRR